MSEDLGSSIILNQQKDIKLDPKRVERKLRLASDLFQMAYDVKCFQLKQKEPNLSEKEIKHRAYALIEKGCK
jgi:hypothetical protein